MNLADVHFLDLPSGRWTIVVTSGQPDRFPGSYWQLFNPEGKSDGMGETKGWDGQGAGSALSAVTLGKAAARRRDKTRRKNG